MYKKMLIMILAGLLVFTASASAAPSSWAEQEVKLAISAALVPEHLQSEYQKAITREEFCEMAMRLWCKLTEKEMPVATATFLDTKNPSVAAAQSLGIVKGESEVKFSPANPVTRQEICVMLQNALKAAVPSLALPESYPNILPDAESVADWAKDAVHCMNLFAVMLGDENGNILPHGHTTREQAILLLYRLFGTQAMTMQEYVETVLMPTNGNSHDNMTNGAFTVCTADRKVYYSGPSGIFRVGESAPVTTIPAKNMQIFGDTLYFIGAEGALYMRKLSSGEETKILEGPMDCFKAENDHIFYRNTLDKKIYAIPLKEGALFEYLPEGATLPIFSANGIFFADGKTIYKVSEDGVPQVQFEGTCEDFCVRGDTLYFLNESGRLCRADLNGANFSVLSRTPARKFLLTRECLLLLGADGGIYKVAYNGQYTIKIDAGTYTAINAYNDDVYALDAEGGIWTITNNGLGKTKLN